jgi:nitroreductase
MVAHLEYNVNSAFLTSKGEVTLDIVHLVTSRRIIKKFKPDMVEESKIKTWLQYASFAPNHRMTEPWEILFIGNETRARLNHKRNFGDAPIVLAILSKHGNTEVEKVENMVAVSCFIQNFLLLAWSEGVGTSWSSLGISPAIRNALHVSDDYEVVGIFGVGFPEEIPDAKMRQSIDEIIKELP